MTRTTHSTVSPKALEQLRSDRVWSMQRLSDAIYDATRIRLDARTLRRFINREVRPSALTVRAIGEFMRAQKPLPQAVNQ